MEHQSRKKGFEVNALSGSIFKNMLLFALPILGTGLLRILFSVADTVVIGRFGHEGAISAIGVSASVLHLLISGLMALGTGVTVVCGRLFGKNDERSASNLLHSLPLTGFLLGCILSVLVIIFTDHILRWISCPDSLMRDAALYFRIYFTGVPFSVVVSLLSAYIHSKGNSVIPFLFEMGAAVLNILMNLVFVIVFDWNVAGVAVATAISQALCAAAFMCYLAMQKGTDRLRIRKLTLFSGLKEVFALGIPAAIEGMVLNVSNVIISAAVNKFDSGVIGGNTIAANIEGIMAIAFVGFANAAVVFISQNHGKDNYPRIKKIFVVAAATVFIGAELLGIIIYSASPILTRIFTYDPVYIASARTRMFFMCLFYGLCGLMNLISGCIRGLGETRLPLIISLICSVAFRITWIYTYAASKGTIESIYVSYPICWALYAAIGLTAFFLVLRKRIRENSENAQD